MEISTNIPQLLRFDAQKLEADGHAEASAKLHAASKARPTLDDFEIVGSLGNGSFGDVVEAKSRLFLNNKHVALKCMKYKERTDYWREVKGLVACAHPNVVEMLGLFFDKRVVIIFERAEKTLETKGVSITKELAFLYMNDILQGLHHLHEHSFAHCDLKPANILIVGGIAKLSDFGTCTQLDGCRGSQIVGKVGGTFVYCSQEVLEHRKVSPQSDLFSLGATLWEVLAYAQTSSHEMKYLTTFVGPRKWGYCYFPDREKSVKFLLHAHQFGRIVDTHNVPKFNIGETGDPVTTALIAPHRFKREPLWRRVCCFDDAWNNMLSVLCGYRGNAECVQSVLSSTAYRDLENAMKEEPVIRMPKNLGKVSVKEAGKLAEGNFPDSVARKLAFEFYGVHGKLYREFSITKAAPGPSSSTVGEAAAPKPEKIFRPRTLHARTLGRKKRKPPKVSHGRPILVDTASGKYKCELCNIQPFSHKSSLSRHRRTKHKLIEKNGKIICLLCGHDFEGRRDNLNRHNCKLSPNYEQIAKQVREENMRKRQLAGTPPTVSSSPVAQDNLDATASDKEAGCNRNFYGTSDTEL